MVNRQNCRVPQFIDGIILSLEAGLLSIMSYFGALQIHNARSSKVLCYRTVQLCTLTLHTEGLSSAINRFSLEKNTAKRSFDFTIFTIK
ncbi:MAG TPA: hypothetical protein DCZ12_09080 [Gammaproteobacteria bacterium]|nr:hypothetical protein [Gammaproteobacteria bacterium]